MIIIEFKLYDDLKWLKGKWTKTEGNGYDILVFENGQSFSILDEYNQNTYANSQTIIECI